MYYSDILSKEWIVVVVGLVLCIIIFALISYFKGDEPIGEFSELVPYVLAPFSPFLIGAIIFSCVLSSSESRTGTLTLHYADGDLQYTIEENQQNYGKSGQELESFVDINGTRGDINAPYDIVWDEE